MKKLLLSITALLATTFALAQEITVDINMGAGYPNEVYFDLSTETSTTYTAADWDIAFLSNNNFDLGIRVNDGVGIKVYEVANTPAGYDTVDVTDQADWVQLYNDPTALKNGAFQQASAPFGWGNYNPSTNTVEGEIVFVLEYADGTFRKLFFESYLFGYTFKCATWNGSAWSADITETLENSSNPDRIYNYYSLVNETALVGEPAEGEWDFVFRRWLAFIDPPGQYNPVTGVFQSPTVTVAQVEETGTPQPNGLDYSEDANTIGWDWKSFSGTGFTVDSDQKFYVRNEDPDTGDVTVYRIYFTDFEGTSTGNLQFVYEDATALLGIEDVTNTISFGMYPNPSTNGKITILIDIATNVGENNSIAITNINGATVLKSNITNQGGFYQKDLDVSSLQSGVYLVTFTSGTASVTKKLIIK